MLNKFLKNLFLFLIYISGLNFLSQIIDKRRKLFLITYHSISSSENKDKLLGDLYRHISIDKIDFGKQIEYLVKNKYEIVNFQNLDEALEDKNIKKIAIIYFDDGFKDNLLNALPILKKYGLTATVFAATGLINRTNFLWPEKLSNWRESDIFMDWEDIKKLSEEGIEIGSHGISHRRLPELEEKEILQELIGSKQELESRLGKKIVVFSYPYCQQNKKTEELVAKAGYSFAVDGKDLIFIDRGTEGVALKKIAVKSGGFLWKFKLNLGILYLLKNHSARNSPLSDSKI